MKKINDRKLLIKRRANEIDRLNTPEYRYSLGKILLIKSLAFFSSKLLKTLGATSAEKRLDYLRRKWDKKFYKNK